MPNEHPVTDPPNEQQTPIGTDDDDQYINLDSDNEDDRHEEPPQNVPPELTEQQRINDSFLKARIEDQDFQRDFKQDKEARTTQPSSGSRDIEKEIEEGKIQRGSERWFTPLRDSKEPYFGYAPVDGVKDLPAKRFAHFSQRKPISQSSRASNSTDPPLNQAERRLIANFQPVVTGQYKLCLMVQAGDNNPTSMRFKARIVVRYIATRTSETLYTTFTKREDEGVVGWHNLLAQGQFEVRAHREFAQVNVCIEQDDTYDNTRGNLWVKSLELVRVGSKQLPNDEHSSSFSIDLRDQDGVVTRVVTSKDSSVVAALTVFSDHFNIHVLSKGRNESWQSRSQELFRLSAIKTVECEDAQNLPLELSISASGDSIAVFQSPMIGDWQPGSKVPQPKLDVKLFRTPLITLYSSSCLIAVNDDDNDNPVPSYELKAFKHDPNKLKAFKHIPNKLKNAVGYGTFVGASRDDDSTTSRFVFCNGLYLDVYRVHGDCLYRSHSIMLADKVSPLCRTDAFEFMMASINSNMFIWVEDNGRHCSTWDLNSGSATGRFGISAVQYGRRVSAPIIKIASNHNTVAVVGSDSSITTVDASSGVTLSHRAFKNQSIERIAFLSNHSDMLLVLLHGEEEIGPTAILVDPLRLDVEFEAPRVPLFSRSCAFGNSGVNNELGSIFQPDGHLIRCHPIVPRGAIAQAAAPDSCQYELKLIAPASPSGADELQKCNAQVEVWRKRGPGDADLPHLVFSFVPEPWYLDYPVKAEILRTCDRFVVSGHWTIQVWSLPKGPGQRCRLLFFWSICTLDEKSSGKNLYGKTEMELVLDSHIQLNAVTIKPVWKEPKYEIGSSDKGKDKDADKDQPARATVVKGESKVEKGKDNVEKVSIPNAPMCLDEYRRTVDSGIKGIQLLALTHTILTSDSQGLPPADSRRNYEYHASAILEFVNELVNHSTLSKGENLTIMSSLLWESCPKDFSAKFIAAILQPDKRQDKKQDKCRWIPRPDQATDPIKAAIKIKNTPALQALLDYCVRKASNCHPNYLIPVESSFGELSEYYSKLLKDFFWKVSYIPAQRCDMLEKDVTIFGLEWELIKWRPWLLIPGVKRPKLDQYRNPILTLQLKEHCRPWLGEKRIDTFREFEIPEPIKCFHESRASETTIKERFDYQAFVVPFPSLITSRKDSQFQKISGRNFFGSPALLTILRYKWSQYGLKYWSMRYAVLALYYGIFIAVTATQMQRSSEVQKPQDLQTLFLEGSWYGLTILGIVLGSVLFIFEIVQFKHDGVMRYLGTLFNYIDVFSIVSSMYLHLIVELRVFRPIGIIVNIIVQIIMRIRAFFTVFILMPPDAISTAPSPPSSGPIQNPVDAEGFLDLDTEDVPFEPDTPVQYSEGSTSEAPRDPLRPWGSMITRAYLKARDIDKTFDRNWKQEKKERAEKMKGPKAGGATSDNCPSQTLTDSAPKVRQVYFLKLKDMSVDDPYFGFEAFENKSESPARSAVPAMSPGAPTELPKGAPEELSAHLYPIKQGYHSRRASGETESQTRSRHLELVANFSPAISDHYALYLKVKQCHGAHLTARFAVRIVVRYDDTKTSDTFFTKFLKSDQDAYADWHYLKAEGHFEVRPRTGKAEINIRIVHDDPCGSEVQGNMLIRSLELVPVGMAPEGPEPCWRDDPLPITRLNISAPSELIVPADAAAHDVRGSFVTRLAVSKNGNFLAALAVHQNRIRIHVWRMKSEGNTFPDPVITPIDEEVDFTKISCEIAISATGDMIAVYQTPMTGNWQEVKSTLQVRIFHNSDTEQGLVPITVPSTIEHSTGFATFVDKLKIRETEVSPRFVFCDGRSVHVFDLKAKSLVASHTISLPDLSSSLWRTMACELLVRSIATNMFIWVEANGDYCSMWDLSSGTAFGRIQITKPHRGDQANTTEMLVTYNKNRIVILGFDNSITIVDATTGIRFGQYQFSGRVVEHIGFPSMHSNMLVVMMREESEVKQRAMILDTCQLNLNIETALEPSLSHLTIFGGCGEKSWPELGMVCQPDGDNIHLFTWRAPDHFWAAPSDQDETCMRSDMDILDGYTTFTAVSPQERTEKDGRKKYFTNAVLERSVEAVSFPDFPLSFEDSKMVSERCIMNSQLLALTYFEIQNAELYGDAYKDHAQALVDFVNTYINYTVTLDRISTTTKTTTRTSPTPSITTTTKTATKISGKFTKAVLASKDCPWFLRYDGDLDPLADAIVNANIHAVYAILDYCARKAHTTHPVYAMAVEHSFLDLSKKYPDILQHFFRKVSYIPADKHFAFTKDYVTYSVWDWRIQGRRLLSKLSKGYVGAPTLAMYKKPIITFKLTESSARSGDEPGASPKNSSSNSVGPRYDQKVYTVPFPGLVKQCELYSKLAGQDLFNSPCLQTVLDYKIVECRVFQPIGEFVSILFEIIKRIGALIIVLFVFMVAFADSFVQLLYVYRTTWREVRFRPGRFQFQDQ
ncbi:hypothetical protein DFQ26_009539 [Actinomortierella ambigua]|nr:hypothetical protein DFQ26_009539 [Actinomortierella ambigua]